MAREVALISGGEIRNKERFIPFLMGQKATVICADKGANHLAGGKLVPDLIVGDMDSISAEMLDVFTKKGADIERHPSHKDQSDTALSLQAALLLKPKRISIYGALGGRIDHALANIALLGSKTAGTMLRIVEDDCELFVVSANRQIQGFPGQLVSFLPFGGSAQGVTLSGFEYELLNGALKTDEPIGISNRLIGTQGVVSIRHGQLLVVQHFKDPLW
ncbi:MAG: thiamine diphosphokinase [Deltaproteobacteria bacterium]|nr:thiamine diphosphokinase [Deltaproteobacteria bacterium]